MKQSFFLYHLICKNIISSLDFVKKNPRKILIFGADNNESYKLLYKKYPKANFLEIDHREKLLSQSNNNRHNKILSKLWFKKIKQKSFNKLNELVLTQDFDFLWSNLYFNKDISIEELIFFWFNLLEDEGMLFCSLIGENSLNSINNFFLENNKNTIQKEQLFDMHKIGDIFYRTGFTDPVITAENINISYNNTTNLIRDLKEVELINTINENEEKKLNLWLQKNKVNNIDIEILYIHAVKKEYDIKNNIENTEQEIKFYSKK